MNHSILFSFFQKWLYPSQLDSEPNYQTTEQTNAMILLQSSSDNKITSDPNIESFQIIDDEKLRLQDTADEIAFNSSTRDVILITVLYMLLHAYCYTKISKYILPQDKTSREFDERIIQSITMHVCAFSLCNVILFVLILPISMISNELLIRHKSSYYLQWLSDDLLTTLWSGIRNLSNMTLFCFLPFSYFFIESEGKSSNSFYTNRQIFKAYKYYTNDNKNKYSQSNDKHEMKVSINSQQINYSQSSNTLKSRFLETCLIFILFSGIVGILTGLLSSFKNLNLFQTFYKGYTFTSLCILLLAAPRGFSRIFYLVGNDLLEQPTYLSKKDEISNIQIKLDTLNRYYNTKLNHSVKRQQINYNFVELKKLEQKYSLLNKSKTAAIWKKLTYPIAFLMLLFLPLISILLCLYHIFELTLLQKIQQNQITKFFSNIFFKILSILKHKELSFYSLFHFFQKTEINFMEIENKSSKINQNNLGMVSLSTFGFLGTFLEAILVVYFYCSCLIGFYTLPKLNKLKPIIENTSLQKMVVNCVLLLTISATLPLLCITLNFVDAHDIINPTKQYSEYFHNLEDENKFLVLLLNILFVVSTCISVIEYLKGNIVQIYRYFTGR